MTLSIVAVSGMNMMRNLPVAGGYPPGNLATNSSAIKVLSRGIEQIPRSNRLGRRFLPAKDLQTGTVKQQTVDQSGERAAYFYYEKIREKPAKACTNCGFIFRAAPTRSSAPTT
jgi:hypothetical protein